eukprot:g16614.t1
MRWFLCGWALSMLGNIVELIFSIVNFADQTQKLVIDLNSLEQKIVGEVPLEETDRVCFLRHPELPQVSAVEVASQLEFIFDREDGKGKGFKGDKGDGKGKKGEKGDGFGKSSGKGFDKGYGKDGKGKGKVIGKGFDKGYGKDGKGKGKVHPGTTDSEDDPAGTTDPQAAEDCDPVKELQNFIDAASKEVSPAPSFARLVAQPFHQLGKGREPRKMTPELQSHLQAPLGDTITSQIEDMEKLRQRLLEPKIRAAFCQVLRLATLKSCFKVALDAADEQNDAWSGRDLMVLAQLYRTEQEGKPVSLLSHVYNHALWNKVTFWEDVLLLSLCWAVPCAGSQFSKPAMTSFLQRFVGYMMAFGISFDQGRNSVAGTLRKNAAFLGQQTVQIYSQLLLSAYEVATPEGTGGQVDSLNVAMTEALPSGGMAPATVDLGGDDFEAVALGVQADFSAEHAVETPSAQGEEATDEEEEKGEETQALRVLDGDGVFWQRPKPKISPGPNLGIW